MFTATPITITVNFVEPTEETLERVKTAKAYLRYNLSKYLEREFWPQEIKRQKKEERERKKAEREQKKALKEAAGAVAPTAGSEKTSCLYQI